jgi:hypothetical protein
MMKTTPRNSVLTLLITLSALALSAKASAAVIVNAQTAIEANINVGSPDSSAWFFGENFFASYGPLTASDWNANTVVSFRGGATLQWDLTGFTNPGDTIGAVNSASFQLAPGQNAAGNTFKVYRLTSAIDENTTWNNKPLLDASTSVDFTMGGYTTLQTIDVSSLLANNGGLQTFGVAILVNTIAGGSTGDFNFWSTAYGNAWPTYGSQNLLNANYAVNAIPEPSTYALVVGGIATLLLIRRRVQA